MGNGKGKKRKTCDFSLCSTIGLFSFLLMVMGTFHLFTLQGKRFGNAWYDRFKDLILKLAASKCHILPNFLSNIP